MKETKDIYNILNRIKNEVYLNVENSDIKLKRQYYKATKALVNAIHEFEILNHLKESE